MSAIFLQVQPLQLRGHLILRCSAHVRPALPATFTAQSSRALDMDWTWVAARAPTSNTRAQFLDSAPRKERTLYLLLVFDVWRRCNDWLEGRPDPPRPLGCVGFGSLRL